MLETLCGHSEAGERWAPPYAPVKEQELLPVYSKWEGVQQVRLHSKQRAQNLQAARHCAKGDQRKGTGRAQPRAHCLQSNETQIITFTPFPNKVQCREVSSGYNSTFSYWKLYRATASSAFWTCTDFCGGEINFFRPERPSQRGNSSFSLRESGISRLTT